MSDFPQPIENGADYIDFRDVIARIEHLRGELPQTAHDVMPGTSDELDDMRLELSELENLADALVGAGGDEEWEGVWYPGSLIRESEFENYARELASDIGAIKADMEWPCNHIDWEAAANALRIDYAEVTFGGVDYLYR